MTILTEQENRQTLPERFRLASKQEGSAEGYNSVYFRLYEDSREFRGHVSAYRMGEGQVLNAWMELDTVPSDSDFLFFSRSDAMRELKRKAPL